MNFSELGLPAVLIAALNKKGISEPMPIQQKSYAEIMAGKDVFIHAETGSGKTLAYLLPLFSKIDLKLAATQVIIVLPTHELAIQVHRVVCDLALGAALAIRAVLLLGGTSYDRQIEKLKNKPQIVVGSCGRILELINKGKLKTKNVKSFVVDESDRLLVDESLKTILGIVDNLPKDRQILYVSATAQPQSAEEITKLSPQLTSISYSQAAVNPNIKHRYLVCDQRDKPDVLRKLIHATKLEKAIVFVHRNQRAEEIAGKLDYHGLKVADLHGAFDKAARKLAMDDFRSGKARVLIASDIAARGLDIPGITHVLNLDIPSSSKDYLHRVGRTARAGAKGLAISIVTDAEVRLVQRYQKDLEIEILEIGMKKGEVFEIKSEIKS